MSLEVQILLPALVACLVLTSFLGYLGIHVLAREVIFVDIALAQIAALGTAVAAYRDIEPHTSESYLWSLGFALVGAAVFALTRSLRRRIPQEAFIGISYAMASALVVLVANSLSHGDEEIKEILVGNLLTVTWEEVATTAAIFAVLGVVHFLLRKPFLTLSFDHNAAGQDDARAILWDLAFYATFAVVITSSVQFAGVLLVFSFLIAPAVFSALFASRLWARLLLGWGLGAGVSVVGLHLSFAHDLPTGATVVVTFGAALLVAALVRVGLNRRTSVTAG